MRNGILGPALVALALTGCAATLSKSDVDRYWALQKENLTAEEPTYCALHRKAMVEGETAVSGGMCVANDKEMRAKLRLFPNSFTTLSSCFCEEPGYRRPHMFCPECRAAEAAWNTKHQAKDSADELAGETTPNACVSPRLATASAGRAAR